MTDEQRLTAELGGPWECLVCGRPITSSDFDRQAVVATGERGRLYETVCVEHVSEPGTAEYRAALESMSQAVATRLAETQ